MKVVVTATGETLEDMVDPRFGRARWFLCVDPDTGKMTPLDNSRNLNAAQGAGIQAADNVVRAEADAVVTGHVGPKAFRVLSAAGIPVWLCESVSVAEAVRRFKAGELTRSDDADVESHWV